MSTTVQLSDLPTFISGLSSEDDQVRQSSVVSIRKLLSVEVEPPIQQVLDSGCVPLLLSFLDLHDSTKLVFETTWAISTLASGSSAQTQYMMSQGVIPRLVALAMSDCNEEIKNQVCWALGKFAGDSVPSRDAILQAGGCEGIIHVLKDKVNTPSRKTKENAFWALANFLRRKPSPPFQLVKSSLPVLAAGLMDDFSSDKALRDIAWALSYISDGSNDRIQAVVETGCVRKLVFMLRGHPRHQIAALRALGNISTGEQFHTATIISAGALPMFKQFLTSDKKVIRKETCWSLSNIIAGPASQIQSVFDAGIFPRILSLFDDESLDVVKEAAWAVTNAVSGGTRGQVLALVEMGAIVSILRLLQSQDPELLTIALEALGNTLRNGHVSGIVDKPYLDIVEDNGGLDILEGLREHESPAVFQKSSAILTNYFNAKGRGRAAKLFP